MDSKTDRQTIENKTVAQLVTEDFRTAQVFSKYGIDFCCGGKQPLSVACENMGLDIKKVQAELESVETSGSAARQQNYAQWKADFLADYIVNVHHGYLRENIPMILEISAKIGDVHGENHPELVEIARLFAEVAADLQQHMVKEEQELFPYIKQLHQAATSGQPLTGMSYGPAAEALGTFEEEHDKVGSVLKQIRLLSHNFTLPADACNTYRVTYAKLDEFEQDIHQHIHLENNILFPKSVELENSCKPDSQKKRGMNGRLTIIEKKLSKK